VPPLEQHIIAQWADRHLGIGFDQLLVIHPIASSAHPSKPSHFFCRIYNANGSEAEQCGNGLRCVARYIHEYLYPQATFQIETVAGIFDIAIPDYEHINVTLPCKKIAITAHVLEGKQNLTAFFTLSLGNPHAIIKTASLADTDLIQLANLITTIFPAGINVGVMEVLSPHHIRLRTIERGVGLTHACGSNACAAVLVGLAQAWLAPKVAVEFTYGSLFIERLPDALLMIGPATNVFSGEIELS
jgi:diaminopimelate epimerase